MRWKLLFFCSWFCYLWSMLVMNLKENDINILNHFFVSFFFFIFNISLWVRVVKLIQYRDCGAV